MTWREYHELTKHSAETLQRTQHHLDWTNMPNPFRHYEGVPIFDLPADPPPQIPALEVLEGKTGNTSATDGAKFFAIGHPVRDSRLARGLKLNVRHPGVWKKHFSRFNRGGEK